jgi:hypothetical protein
VGWYGKRQFLIQRQNNFNIAFDEIFKGEMTLPHKKWQENKRNGSIHPSIHLKALQPKSGLGLLL